MIICKWDGCGQVFDDDKEILSHIEQHVGYPKKRNFSPHCKWDNNCGSYKPNRGSMLSHLLVHFDVRPFVCACSKKFKRKHDLLVHTRKCKRSIEFKDPLKQIINEVERNI